MSAKVGSSLGRGGIGAESYSARYSAAFPHLINAEGGYSDHAADRGGATKYGISLRFLVAEGKVDLNRDGVADFDLDMDGDIDAADIRALTIDHAKALYWRCFWLPVRAEQFPRPLGEAMFDQAVNGGLVSARKLLQRAVNLCLMQAERAGGMKHILKVDGEIGPATSSAVLWVLQYPAQGMPALLRAFRDAVKERYRAIAARDPSQAVFLKGWLARADRLGRDGAA